MPEEGTAFISVKDSDKAGAVTLARRLTDMGFRLLATRGTAVRIREAGLDCQVINKVLGLARIAWTRSSPARSRS